MAHHQVVATQQSVVRDRTAARVIYDRVTYYGRQVKSKLVPALVFLIHASGSVSAQEEILVGVISPTGSGRAIGEAHEETISYAFGKTTGVIETRDRAVPLRVEYESDGGDPHQAVAVARRLVAAGAVAILGPVDSGSTDAVLKAGLNVPVISALSTATSLSSADHDGWFFRMTLSDDDRIRTYMETLSGYPDRFKAPQYTLIRQKSGRTRERLFDSVEQAFRGGVTTQSQYGSPTWA